MKQNISAVPLAPTQPLNTNRSAPSPQVQPDITREQLNPEQIKREALLLRGKVEEIAKQNPNNLKNALTFHKPLNSLEIQPPEVPSKSTGGYKFQRRIEKNSKEEQEANKKKSEPKKTDNYLEAEARAGAKALENEVPIEKYPPAPGPPKSPEPKVPKKPAQGIPLFETRAARLKYIRDNGKEVKMSKSGIRSDIIKLGQLQRISNVEEAKLKEVSATFHRMVKKEGVGNGLPNMDIALTDKALQELDTAHPNVEYTQNTPSLHITPLMSEEVPRIFRTKLKRLEGNGDIAGVAKIVRKTADDHSSAAKELADEKKILQGKIIKEMGSEINTYTEVGEGDKAVNAWYREGDRRAKASPENTARTAARKDMEMNPENIAWTKPSKSQLKKAQVACDDVRKALAATPANTKEEKEALKAKVALWEEAANLLKKNPMACQVNFVPGALQLFEAAGNNIHAFTAEDVLHMTLTAGAKDLYRQIYKPLYNECIRVEGELHAASMGVHFPVHDPKFESTIRKSTFITPEEIDKAFDPIMAGYAKARAKILKGYLDYLKDLREKLFATDLPGQERLPESMREKELPVQHTGIWNRHSPDDRLYRQLNTDIAYLENKGTTMGAMAASIQRSQITGSVKPHIIHALEAMQVASSRPILSTKAAAAFSNPTVRKFLSAFNAPGPLATLADEVHISDMEPPWPVQKFNEWRKKHPELDKGFMDMLTSALPKERSEQIRSWMAGQPVEQAKIGILRCMALTEKAEHLNMTPEALAQTLLDASEGKPVDTALVLDAHINIALDLYDYIGYSGLHDQGIFSRMPFLKVLEPFKVTATKQARYRNYNYARGVGAALKGNWGTAVKHTTRALLYDGVSTLMLGRRSIPRDAALIGAFLWPYGYKHVSQVLDQNAWIGKFLHMMPAHMQVSLIPAISGSPAPTIEEASNDLKAISSELRSGKFKESVITKSAAMALAAAGMGTLDGMIGTQVALNYCMKAVEASEQKRKLTFYSQPLGILDTKKLAPARIEKTDAADALFRAVYPGERLNEINEENRLRDVDTRNMHRMWGGTITRFVDQHLNNMLGKTVH